MEFSPSYYSYLVHIPPLVGLYLGNNDVLASEIDESRWDIFQFIMSFSDEEISKIKGLDEKYRLICTVLYALVQVFCIKLMFEVVQIIHTAQSLSLPNFKDYDVHKYCLVKP